MNRRVSGPSSPAVAAVVVLGSFAGWTVYGAPASAVAQWPSTLGGVAAPDSEVGRVESEIAERLSKIESLEAEEQRAGTEAKALAAQRDAAQLRLRGRTRALYRVLRAGHLPTAGGIDGVLAHVSRVERLERMVKRELAAIELLRVRGKMMRDDAERARRELDRLGGELAQLRAAREALDHAPLATAVAVNPIAPAVEAPEYGVLRVHDAPPARGLAVLRGRLPSPIGGTADVRASTHGEGPGLELVAPAGTPVRAVADGRVAYQGRYGQYGELVIVDHGDEHFTLYGNLAQVEVEVGDMVGQGARIGVVGRAIDPAALLFEIREGSRTIEPRPWLGL